MIAVPRPRTLAARLVVTAVALVAVVSVLIALSATLAIRATLMDRLDDSVQSSVRRVGAGDPPGGAGEGPGLPGAPATDPTEAPRRDRGGDRGGGRGPTPDNQGPRTLIAALGPESSAGVVLTEERGGEQPLSEETLTQLADVPVDGAVHGVHLRGLGSYRLAAVAGPAGETLVSGLPTAEVDETVLALVGYEALLILLGVATAAVAGTVLVRRRLRPLTEVAATAHSVSALPLSAGEIDLAERVPAHLTDERTEVGRMGAALNTLLSHVETSLEARHRSEQQVRQFVGDASHELRTPLATIHGYAELSRRTPDDPEALSAALTKVEVEADRMSALVEDLLLLARLDAGRPLDRTEVDITRMLLESVADARVLAPTHTWRLDLPGEPVTVVGDERRLHQVVTNLLTNARHHTPAGTTVTVAAARVDGRVRVSVHDDGPGLAPGLDRSAFERFTRGDSSRTRASGGAGLGLSLVSAIVSAHGGDTEVASRPGDTTFTATLPG